MFDTVGNRKTGVLVDRGETSVVPCLCQRLGRGALVEGSNPGKTHLSLAYDPHAQPGRFRRGHGLDGVLEDADRCLTAASDVRLELLAGAGAGDDGAGELDELSHLPSRQSSPR